MKYRKIENYYKELPQDFKAEYCVNSKDPKTGFLFAFINLTITAVVFAVCFIVKFGIRPEIDSVVIEIIEAVLCSAFCFLAYVVVHEITHGIFYKILTKQKLTFGFTTNVAYCGLKDGFVNKKTSLLASSAPFVIHSVWMIALICILPPNFWNIMLIALFALHCGGCCYDLYVVILLLTKFNGKDVLVSDSGPCQTFYTRFRAD